MSPAAPSPRPPHRVVVTGLGAVSPNGIGVPAFWEATRAGRSGVRAITTFPVDHLPTRIAATIPAFREEAYVPAAERRHLSRTVALGRAAAREALQDAGIPWRDLDLPGQRALGVVIGSGGGPQDFTERQYARYFAGTIKQASVYTIPSSTPGSLASELSMAFRCKGLSHLLSTGCTSATDAIGYAFEAVRRGRLGAVLTGGVDAPVSPGIFAGFCLMKVMSRRWNHQPARASRPFSRDRDGFVLGEGAWMLVLESWERARARGAAIHAEVAGYGATCDAYHRVRLEEDGVEPARAMTLALADAGLDREAIGYVSLHGTGTRLNDRIETRAVRRCFGAQAERLATSALKSMIGHPQGASGAAAAVATILGLRDAFFHPTINRDLVDPECDLDYLARGGRRIETAAALCNCIGFGSKNSALVFRRWEG